VYLRKLVDVYLFSYYFHFTMLTCGQYPEDYHTRPRRIFRRGN